MGEAQFLHEHRFTKKDRWTGMPMCGHRTADAVWLAHDLLRHRPAGYLTVEEYTASGSWDLPGAQEQVAELTAKQIKDALRKLATSSR
ncbi:hypothetical protein ACFQ2B_27810 [Streptomyces stramineus]